MTAKTLFVGIGSSHGDDRLGWHVADALADRLQASHAGLVGDDSAGLASTVLQQSRVVVRKAGSPVEVLDWIEGTERLIVCDACRSGAPPGFTYRWSWPDRAIERASCSGSHDLALASVLELAQRLHRLPPAVVVWGIEADTLKLHDDLSAIGFSPSVAAHLADVVDSIWNDLGHASTAPTTPVVDWTGAIHHRQLGVVCENVNLANRTTNERVT